MRTKLRWLFDFKQILRLKIIDVGWYQEEQGKVRLHICALIPHPRVFRRTLWLFWLWRCVTAPTRMCPSLKGAGAALWVPALPGLPCPYINQSRVLSPRSSCFTGSSALIGGANVQHQLRAAPLGDGFNRISDADDILLMLRLN